MALAGGGSDMPGRFLVALVLMLAAPALAAEDDRHVAEAGPIRVVHAWARATTQSEGAAFMEIENRGPTADRLIAASSPSARAVVVHGAVLEGGTVASRPLGPLDLPAGAEFELEPAGVFLKLEGLRGPLREGGGLELELTFEKAGVAEVHAEVGAAGATGHSHAGHGL